MLSLIAYYSSHTTLPTFQEAEFHHYCRPWLNPVLSDFCKKLTCIQQVSTLLFYYVVHAIMLYWVHHCLDPYLLYSHIVSNWQSLIPRAWEQGVYVQASFRVPGTHCFTDWEERCRRTADCVLVTCPPLLLCRTKWTRHLISQRCFGCSQSGLSPRSLVPSTSLLWSQTGKQEGLELAMILVFC